MDNRGRGFLLFRLIIMYLSIELGIVFGESSFKIT